MIHRIFLVEVRAENDEALPDADDVRFDLEHGGHDMDVVDVVHDETFSYLGPEDILEGEDLEYEEYDELMDGDHGSALESVYGPEDDWYDNNESEDW
jgi:hypothetical protein